MPVANADGRSMLEQRNYHPAQSVIDGTDHQSFLLDAGSAFEARQQRPQGSPNPRLRPANKMSFHNLNLGAAINRPPMYDADLNHNLLGMGDDEWRQEEHMIGDGRNLLFNDNESMDLHQMHDQLQDQGSIAVNGLMEGLTKSCSEAWKLIEVL